MKAIIRSSARVAAGVAVGYALLVAVIYLLQDACVFLPQPPAPVRLDDFRTPRQVIEEVTVRTPDGVTLAGWFVRKTFFPRSPVVIYYAGNADEASSMLHTAPWMGEWSAAFINYRGYGRSGGKPSQKALYDDALRVFDAITSRPDVDRRRVVVFGRSLGSGIAVYVASRRPVAGVITASPYDSIASIGQETFPFVPVRLLLKHPFDALSLAPRIQAPLLALIAANDVTVTPRHSHRLIERWGGERTVVTVPGVDHNSLLYTALYWNSIDRFLGRMLNPSS